MSLETTKNRETFLCNGSAVEYPFPFKVWETGNVKVFSDASGVQEDVTSSVTITLSSGGAAGGTVTFAEPPVSGAHVAVVRSMPFIQEDSYINGTRIDPHEFEDRLDQDCAERQELKDGVDRAVKLPETSPKTADEFVNELFGAAASASESAVQAASILDAVTSGGATWSAAVASAGSAYITSMGDVYSGYVDGGMTTLTVSSGATISGGLTVNGGELVYGTATFRADPMIKNDQPYLNFVETDVVCGSGVVSGNGASWAGLRFWDSAGVSGGGLIAEVLGITTSNADVARLLARDPSGGSGTASVQAVYSGGVAYGTAPTPPAGDSSTKIATTKFVSDGCVTVSGAQVVSGAKSFTSSVTVKNGANGIVTSNASSYVQVCGGQSNANAQGATLTVCGTGYSANPGGFALKAATSSSAKVLRGKPDGTLTWGDVPIALGEVHSIAEYGAVADDPAAANDNIAALNEAFSHPGKVVFEANKTYYYGNSPLFVSVSNIDIDLNGATLDATPPVDSGGIPTTSHTVGRMINLMHPTAEANVTSYNGLHDIYIHGGTYKGGGICTFHNQNVHIYDMQFLNRYGAHQISVFATKGCYIHDCYFSGLYSASDLNFENINIDPATYSASSRIYPSGSGCYDHTKNMYVMISNCFFVIGSEGFANMEAAIGVHDDDTVSSQSAQTSWGLHYGVHVHGCHINGATYNGIRLNCCERSSVVGCSIETKKYALNTGGPGDSAYDRGLPSRNILFADNHMMGNAHQNDVNPIHIQHNGVVWLSCHGNSYRDLSNNVLKRPLFAFDSKAADVPSPENFSFAKLQRTLCPSSSSTSGNTTTITSTIPLTSVDTIELVLGTLGSNTYQAHTIRSYYTRNFQAGDSHPIQMSTGAVIHVTITDPYTLTLDSSSWTYRCMYVSCGM